MSVGLQPICHVGYDLELGYIFFVTTLLPSQGGWMWGFDNRKSTTVMFYKLGYSPLSWTSKL